MPSRARICPSASRCDPFSAALMPLAWSQRPQARAVAGSPGRLAVGGERVEEGVGGGVVGLGGAAQQAGGRGEEEELGELQLRGQLVQVPGGVDLGPHHPLELLAVERLEHAVVEHAGGVDNGAERVLGGDRVEQGLELVAVG